jgi:hypothetical protein
MCDSQHARLLVAAYALLQVAVLSVRVHRDGHMLDRPSRP